MVDENDRMKKLLDDEDWEDVTPDERDDRIDIFWKPTKEDVGREFRGIFEGMRYFTSSEGEEFSKIIILTTDHERIAIQPSTVLENSFKKIKPDDGVYIKYLGKIQSKRGSDKYHNYRVKVKHFTE
jgi:hypothetical protein